MEEDYLCAGGVSQRNPRLDALIGKGKAPTKAADD
jgi:hypothetical protein